MSSSTPLAMIVLLGSIGLACEPRPAAQDAAADTSASAALPTHELPVESPAKASPAINDSFVTGTPNLPVALPDQSGTTLPADTGTVTATPSDLAQLAGRLIIPVRGVVRAQLRDTYTESRGAHVHDAIDILAARGTPVVAAANGRLLRLFNSRPGGLMVYATDESERFILLYGHLDSYAAGVTNGMKLQQGQVIGYVGTTGNAPPGTPHLHFGILRGRPSVSWSKGEAVNPYPLLMQSQ